MSDDLTFSQWYTTTVELLDVTFVQHAVMAAAMLGIISGIVAPLIVIRRMAFAVHGTAELALMGASAALLAGINIGYGAIMGSVVAGIVLTLLGMRETDTSVGVTMSFGLGLSVLFIYLYEGKASTALSLLTGQIVGVNSHSLTVLGAITVIVVGAVLLLWRPLLFASVDPDVARATGIPATWLAVIFAALVGLVAAQGVQIVGALLVVSLLITPGAAAVQVTSSPLGAVVLSTLFAELAAVGGILLSLAPGLPVSVFVTSISFGIYIICRIVASVRERLGKAFREGHGDDERAVAPDHHVAVDAGPVV